MPTGTTPAIEMIQVAKSFGDTEVLQPLSIAVAPGEFMILLGPSGCGKSTILKMIAGLEDLSDGEIYVDGKLVNYVRPKERNVAMVFQNYALYPHMTVRDNIAFPLRQLKRPRLSRSEINQRVLSAAEIVTLSDLLDRRPAQLSGGQRQRVALARAIVRQPAVFLMDEPLSNLDALLRAEMRTSLLEMHNRVGRATVYVTHDQIEAMTMADRIVVLEGGRLQQVGTPHDLYDAPANTFVARFIGSPQMLLLTAEVGPALDVVFEGVRLLPDCTDGMQAGRPATIGLRPTGLRVVDDDSLGHLSGTVMRRDYLGSDCFVEVKLDRGRSVQARADPARDRPPGDTVALAIGDGAAHLFDDRGVRVAGLSPVAP